MTTGVATTTLGFGQHFNEELLTAMADAGRGAAHFIASPEDAPAAFAAEFADLVSLVDRNISVEIRPIDAVEVVAVLNDHPTTAVAGGVQVQAGDAYAGQDLRVVFKVALASLAALGPAKIADVVLRYVSVGDEVAAHEVTYPLLVNLVSADEAATAVPDAEVVEEQRPARCPCRGGRAPASRARRPRRGSQRAARRRGGVAGIRGRLRARRRAAGQRRGAHRRAL